MHDRITGFTDPINVDKILIPLPKTLGRLQNRLGHLQKKHWVIYRKHWSSIKKKHWVIYKKHGVFYKKHWVIYNVVNEKPNIPLCRNNITTDDKRWLCHLIRYTMTKQGIDLCMLFAFHFHRCYRFILTMIYMTLYSVSEWVCDWVGVCVTDWYIWVTYVYIWTFLLTFFQIEWMSDCLRQCEQ